MRPPWRLERTHHSEQEQARVRVRAARPEDEDALMLLAQLEGTRVPTGAILVAEVEGVIRAAFSIDDGRVLADPFQPTSELAELLRASGRTDGDLDD